jgi:hypothetical protein
MAKLHHTQRLAYEAPKVAPSATSEHGFIYRYRIKTAPHRFYQKSKKLVGF